MGLLACNDLLGIRKFLKTNILFVHLSPSPNMPPKLMRMSNLILVFSVKCAKLYVLASTQDVEKLEIMLSLFK